MENFLQGAYIQIKEDLLQICQDYERENAQ